MQKVRRFGTEGTHFWKRGNRYDYALAFSNMICSFVKKRTGGAVTALENFINDPTADEIARMKLLIRHEKGHA